MTRFTTLLFLSLLTLQMAMAIPHGISATGRTVAHAPHSLHLSSPVKHTNALATPLGAQPIINNSSMPNALAVLPTGQTPVPGLSMYPNPARGQTTVQVSGPGGADYKLRLSNVLGGEVLRLPVHPDNQTTEGVALDLSDLPPGLYFCSLLANEKTVVTKRLTVL